MAKAFADIAFTPSVKAAQARYGAREINRPFELADDPGNRLGPAEAAFIEARDSFYMATVNERGWPYVQHRGGPAGFLKVLDERTIGFADFRGNRQYLSVGNLDANERVSLILMDYPNRARLKLWGRARIIHPDDAGALARLEVPTYRARVERGIVITIEAIEWNCPQHITPRYTEAEIASLLAPLVEENTRLKGLTRDPLPRSLGDGPLALTVTGVRRLTPRVRGYELRAADGSRLPAFAPGAHLKVPVVLEDGRLETRSYSICSDPGQLDHYEIAVLREEPGRGGSQAIHRDYGLGCALHCALPEIHFALHEDLRPAVLIAGGIGITPIRAMAKHLHRSGRDFFLHYAGRARSEMAFLDELQTEYAGKLRAYSSAELQGMDVQEILASGSSEAVFYVCGPGRLIDAVRDHARVLGIPAERIRHERFVAASIHPDDRPVTLTLRRSMRVVDVPADQSLLDAMLAAGIDARFSCRSGECRTCAVAVLDGEPDHRDQALTDTERSRQKLICPCVSRARGDTLTLDL